MIAEEAAKYLISTLNVPKKDLAVWIHRALKIGDQPRPKPCVCFALNPDMPHAMKSAAMEKAPADIGGILILQKEWSAPVNIDVETANNPATYLKAAAGK